jgi:broad specificity phosphatase PhoE
VAAAHRRVWTEAVREVPDGGTALVISSGGAIEPSLVACLPGAEHARWGSPFSHCDGARLTYADGGFVSAVLSRAPVAI